LAAFAFGRRASPTWPGSGAGSKAGIRIAITGDVLNLRMARNGDSPVAAPIR
jgi:hypothetical protein